MLWLRLQHRRGSIKVRARALRRSIAAFRSADTRTVVRPPL